MRWSQGFVPTLRDDPADAEAPSHRLLVRAGFVRQLTAGLYSVLPLGFRTYRKVERIVREEIDRIGGQEFQLPTLHPADAWRRSGRWDAIGEELFRLKDRRGTEMCLGLSAEELFASLAGELRSYKQLPQTWYQINVKFRDEPRPKAGLLRVREFDMMDSYSLDLAEEGLDRAFDSHLEAYRRIFDRCGLETLAVEASVGVMGGSASVEFMARSDAGEDLVAACGACGYAANVEKATSRLPEVEDPAGADAPERFATPGVRTIDALAGFEGGAPAERQIKTLVYEVGDEIVLALLRGDHSLVEQKLADAVGVAELRPAEDARIRASLGASAGSLGAVGVRDLRILADPALQGRRAMVTGANEDDFHLRGVDVGRDIPVSEWVDLREVVAGEACPMCDAPLGVDKYIEVGHCFKLGTRYSVALEIDVLDENGAARPIVMGSYGIGIGRALAAIVEQHHDDAGIVWPVSVAPYEVVISILNPKDPATAETGAGIYEALQAAGIDVILDDRDERPGVKFKDAELVGIPYRVTVGPKGLADGKVEFTRRRDGRMRAIDVQKASEVVSETVLEERR